MLNYNSAVATAELQNNKNHIQNFRMWFKFGLKAQKLLAQGIALGNYELLPFQGVLGNFNRTDRTIMDF